MEKKYYCPQLIVRCGSEKELFDSLAREEEREPFPFILDIIDTPKYEGKNKRAIKSLESIGLRRGEIFQIRRIPPAFGEVYPMPRLCVSENNPFGLLPFICYDADGAIKDYLERFREDIQVGLIEMREGK